MLSDDLVLCSGTVMAAGFREMVEAASAAGFAAITLWPKDYRDARAAGLSDSDLRALLEDHGLSVEGLDPLLTWLPPEASGGIDPGPFADATEQDFYAIAEAVGARSLNVAQGFGATLDFDLAAEALAGVCTRAREHGLLVTVEFLPWSGIPDVATALDLCERTGCENATVMVDTWHFFRGPSTLEQLSAVPAARIGSVQLNDAPAEPAADLVAETMQARLLPGEGDAPVVDVLRTLSTIGSKAPIGVEVFSKALAEKSTAEVARLAAEAGRRVLALSRS